MHSSLPSTSSATASTSNSQRVNITKNCTNLPDSKASTPSSNELSGSKESQENDETKRVERNQAIKQVYKFFVDSLVTNTVIKYHRDISLNSIVGLQCKADTLMPLAGTKKAQSNDSLSSAQSSSSSSNKPLAPIRKQIECVCYSCNRVIAALRLAPHLEKCIGLGRNSSRVARKRLTNFATVKSQSASSSSRISTRVSMSSNTTDISAIDDALESEDTEWRASRTPPNIAKRRKTNLNHKVDGPLPPNNNIQPTMGRPPATRFRQR